MTNFNAHISSDLKYLKEILNIKDYEIILN